MPTAIQLLRTTQQNLRPNPTTLSDGMPMVALHESDPGLYFKLQDDSLCKIAPCAISATSPNSSAIGQTGNAIGEFWLDTSAAIAQLKVWDGTQWITTNSSATAANTLDEVTSAGSVTTNGIEVGALTVASLIYPTTDGVSGQFLQTDGSGNLSWATATAVAAPGGANGQVQFNDNGVMDGTAMLTMSGTDVILGGSMVPDANNTLNMGSNGQRMNTVFTTTLDVADNGTDAGTF